VEHLAHYASEAWGGLNDWWRDKDAKSPQWQAEVNDPSEEYQHRTLEHVNGRWVRPGTTGGVPSPVAGTAGSPGAVVVHITLNNPIEAARTAGRAVEQAVAQAMDKIAKNRVEAAMTLARVMEEVTP